MFPLFSKIFRAKSEFYNSVGVLSRFLGPWSYIADVCQKYFGGELNSIILGGLINQRLGLYKALNKVWEALKQSLQERVEEPKQDLLLLKVISFLSKAFFIIGKSLKHAF